MATNDKVEFALCSIGLLAIIIFTVVFTGLWMEKQDKKYQEFNAKVERCKESYNVKGECAIVLEKAKNGNYYADL